LTIFSLRVRINVYIYELKFIILVKESYSLSIELYFLMFSTTP